MMKQKLLFLCLFLNGDIKILELHMCNQIRYRNLLTATSRAHDTHVTRGIYLDHVASK
jgi:hypothetical protein